jgi:hypothetical protein
MHPDKYLELMCESFLLQRIVGLLPSDLPFRRDLLIQNAKLQRLLEKRPETAGMLLGGGSAKKVNKLLGQHYAMCGRQAKLVRSMAEKSFREWLRQEWPRQGKAFTKKEFRKWQSGFNAGVSGQARKIAKQITEGVMLRLAAKAPPSK